MLEILAFLAFLFLGAPLLAREVSSALDRRRYKACLANIARMELEMGWPDVLTMYVPYLWWRERSRYYQQYEWARQNRPNYHPARAVSAWSWRDFSYEPGAVWWIEDSKDVQLVSRGLSFSALGESVRVD